MVEKALAYARRVHSPDYLPHPVQVMENLRDVGREERDFMLATALLHDTLEWGDGDLDEIKAEFGAEVSMLVGQLTREEPDSAQFSKKELSKVRHQILLAEIDEMSDEAKKIKLADRLTNLRERIETDQSRLQNYLAKTVEILQHIDRGISPPLWDAIQDLVQEHSAP